MKLDKILFAAITIVSLAAVSSGQLSSKPITFKKDIFQYNLKDTLNKNAMGYQFVLIKDGQVVVDDFGGKARNNSDGNMPMSATTPQNIGSLQKFITGTAMLNLMVHRSPYSPSKENTLQQGLNTPIYSLFPKVWLDDIGNVEVRDITIRHLLQHRSGFDMQYAGDRTVMGYLKGGQIPSQLGKYEYANINFVLTGYLIPLYEHGSLAADYNVEFGKLVPLLEDSNIRDKLGDRFNQILFERIFNKMNPKINPSCDATNVMENTASYGYTSKDDHGHGEISSQEEKKGHCTGEGGYFMSARDLANYVAHVSSTDLIVNKEARDAMFTDNDDPNDRLVWALAHPDDWMKQHFNMPYVAWSNGIPAHHRSVILRLPQNYYLIIVTNTPDLDVVKLRDAGLDAFKAGMAHNFAN
jgi:CubicO group peptidase (beta-lactamase class C family)